MQSAYLLLPSGARLLPLAQDPITRLQSRAPWPAFQALDTCRRSPVSLQTVSVGRSRQEASSWQPPVACGAEVSAAQRGACAGFQGKSIAMAVESRVIQALRGEGFALISDHDARTQRSPHVA